VYTENVGSSNLSPPTSFRGRHAKVLCRALMRN
jgi:hypothetical protein